MVLTLRERREAEGMTQGELAGIVGVSREMISHVENGRKAPGVRLAKRLGRALAFDWAELYEEVDDGLRDV